MFMLCSIANTASAMPLYQKHTPQELVTYTAQTVETAPGTEDTNTSETIPVSTPRSPMHQTAFKYAQKTLKLDTGDAVEFVAKVMLRPDRATYVRRHKAAFKSLKSTLGHDMAIQHANQFVFQMPTDWQHTSPQSSVFGSYFLSEAHTLRMHSKWRHHSTQFQKFTFSGHRLINIDSKPDPLQYSYTIHDPSIAQALHIKPGDTLTDKQVKRLSDSKKYLIAINVEYADKITRAVYQMNPLFKTRPLLKNQQEYFTHLNQLVDQLIRNLDTTSPNQYYWNKYSLGIGIHKNEIHWEIFSHLMHAIAHNQEDAFITCLVALATSFTETQIDSKNGFIQTFIYLFISKQFPSKGIRNTYLHFCLQCGNIE